MGNQELQKTLESMESVRRDLSSSDDKVLAFLIEAGILDSNGDPARPSAQNA